ncbi:MAG: TetR/AcrR family transcriptional regulator [Fusobacteriota bacterium]
MAKNTREKIINAAIGILEENNYQNMKTAEIAKKAGVAEGTLYRYFKNKESIFTDLLKEYVVSVTNQVFYGVSPEKSLIKNLKILADNFYTKVLGDKKIYKITYKAFSEIEIPEIKEILRKTLDSKLNKLENIFKWEIDKKDYEIEKHELELLALSVWGIAEVLIKKHILDSKKKNTKKDIEKLLLVYAELLDSKVIK